MQRLSFNKIDTKTHEGRLLFAALVELTTRLHTDKTPEEVVDLLYSIAAKTDEANRIEEPWTDTGNVYWQIDQLAKFIMSYMPGEISEGGAIEVAIKILSRPTQSEAIVGFINHLCTNVHGITVGQGFSPDNTLPELKKYCQVNEFPEPRDVKPIPIKFPE